MNAPITATDSLVVGQSPRMRAVFDFLRVIGSSESTVLVTGESGTGKEVIATFIPRVEPAQTPTFRRGELRAVFGDPDRIGTVRS